MNWNEYFMNIAKEVAKKSKDKSTKIGCVIVGPEHEIRSTGYNSFPRGINDYVEERQQRPEKYKWIEHAERNAIYAAAKIGTQLNGCTAYVTWIPCAECSRALIQSGIKEVVALDIDVDNPTWKEDFKITKTLFKEANVKLLFYCEETN